MLKLIHIPRLRMQELQSVAERSIEFSADIVEVTEERQEVENQLDAFRSGMLKSRASAADKDVLDKSRGRLVSGFFHDLKAERCFPEHDELTNKTIEQIWNVGKRYGTGITRLSQKEETVAIDNLLRELKTIDNLSPETMHIGRWIPLLDESNLMYKKASGEFISQNAEANEIDAAGIVAPILTKALEELYMVLFSHINVSKKENIKQAYSKIQLLVESFE